MAFTKTNPVAGSDANKLMGTIRTNNEGLETSIAQDHDFITGSTQTGKHNKITLKEQSGDQTTAANEMALYCKDLGAAPGLYIRPQSNGTAIQATGADGKWLGAATDMLDEDDMASDSAVKTASQQSIKAYSDSGTQTMTNKTLTAPVVNTAQINGNLTGDAILDEDNMASNSAVKVATQQSIKQYIADQIVARMGQSTQVTGGSDITNTSGDWADMTGMSITITTKGGNVLLSFHANLNSSTAWQVGARFKIDASTYQGYAIAEKGGTDNDHGNLISQTLVTSLAAGSHTFKVQWKDYEGTAEQPGATWPREFSAIELPI